MCVQTDNLLVIGLTDVIELDLDEVSIGLKEKYLSTCAMPCCMFTYVLQNTIVRVDCGSSDGI